MKGSDIVGIVTCTGLYHKRHCWKTCFAMWFFIGLAIMLYVFKFLYPLGDNVYVMYTVASGILFGIGGIIFYLIRHGKIKL